MTQLIANCPQCGGPAILEKGNAFRPFCSERCKLLDLGEWFAEKHGIPAEDATPDDGAGIQDPDRLQ